MRTSPAWELRAIPIGLLIKAILAVSTLFIKVYSSCVRCAMNSVVARLDGGDRALLSSMFLNNHGSADTRTAYRPSLVDVSEHGPLKWT